ncbi:unnamed protein product [Rotaria sordida]|uniref:Uncharacterized protein n=1 Tax=Rotaria sordida TaxID=392033 RepID=A0A814XMM9_9BILA|nr:unnamed protein product [Rotaria sordida]
MINIRAATISDIEALVRVHHAALHGSAPSTFYEQSILQSWSPSPTDKDQPKDITKNYTVHIDAYDRIKLIHGYHCEILCNSRYYEQKGNNNIGSCQCELNNSEMTPIDQDQCNCSLDSICIGILNH